MENRNKSTNNDNYRDDSYGANGRNGGKPKLISALIMVAIILFAILMPEQFNAVIGMFNGGAQTGQYGDGGVISASEVNDITGLYAAFIDVGQGDSIFLRSPNGKTALVDAGTGESFGAIDEFLKSQGVTKLDIVVATHPHSDHIGSMRKVIQNYEIGKFYMPDAVNNTYGFEKMLDELEKYSVKTVTLYGGSDKTLDWDEDAEVRVLSPLKNVDYGNDLNEMSIVLRVRYQGTSLLLTGDAGKEAEEAMLNDGGFPLRSNIIKVGHHGSSSSSTKDFIAAVAPDIAVISLGKDNDYGHPHKETMELLNSLNIPIYRTDQLGTVCMILDGNYVYSVEFAE